MTSGPDGRVDETLGYENVTQVVVDPVEETPITIDDITVHVCRGECIFVLCLRHTLAFHNIYLL